MFSKSYFILTIILFLSAVMFAQGDPANPAQANEKIKSGEIKSRWVESNIARVFPEPFEIYKSKCLELANKREKLLEKIKKMSFAKLSYSLEAEMIGLPDFEQENVTKND